MKFESEYIINKGKNIKLSREPTSASDDVQSYFRKLQKVSNTNSCILIVWVILVFAFMFFSDSVTELFVSRDNGNFATAQTLIVFLFQYVIAVPLSLLVFKMSKDFLKSDSCFCKPKMPAKWVFKWILISLALVYISSYISSAFFAVLQQITGVKLHAIDMTADNNTLSRITNIIAMMFLAPFFEEILFRGTLLKNSTRHGTWSMIIVMGIIFGLWHGNYAQTLYTAVMGICAGFLIVKTESIFPSILLHFCMNTIGALQSLFVGNIDEEKLLAEDSEYIMSNFALIMVTTITYLVILAIMITGLIFFILEIINHKDSFKLKGINTKVSEVKKTVLYFTAPVTIIVTLIFVAVTVINAIDY